MEPNEGDLGGQTADERDQIADERERLADERQQAADARERRADLRDEQIAARIARGDRRDAAAADRVRQMRVRLDAARHRDEEAAGREAAGDHSGSAAERKASERDRDAQEIDAIWAGRDGDDAADDRALLAGGLSDDHRKNQLRERESDAALRKIAGENRTRAMHSRHAHRDTPPAERT
ncbi:MAG TPA: hypothetical protein VHX15_20490 [Frankiaceae bacterium]|nr:hypothetical protein [Frankiaceae bacterium]